MIASTLCLHVADEQHPLKIFQRHLTATKNEPLGSPRSQGFYRLLPQLVGSSDTGGGDVGDGVPPALAY
jgi:hypothetical protein